VFAAKGAGRGFRAREQPGGHSPFLARPALLADELLAAAKAHGLV
jgi:hypothetical protein